MRERIDDLINGGDWACSWAYAGGLSTVCHQLADMLELPLARRARHIASIARVDMRSASREWGELADELRARHRAGYPSSAPPSREPDPEGRRKRRRPGPEPSRTIL